jgi:hypothetical protein
LLGYLLLAQSAVALDDRAAARDLVEEAERVRRLEPTATHLNDQLDELRGQLTTGDLHRPGGFPSLTRAELRVLPYLTTHLSLQDVADQLIVSRNTAKSHTVALHWWPEEDGHRLLASGQLDQQPAPDEPRPSAHEGVRRAAVDPDEGWFSSRSLRGHQLAM